jgi:hypothetical protein
MSCAGPDTGQNVKSIVFHLLFQAGYLFLPAWGVVVMRG